MAAVNSTMQELGSAAIDFSLPNVSEAMRPNALEDAVGQPVFLMFICNHCPFVIHLIEPLVELANWAAQQGVAVYAISSNDIIHYPQDGPEKMQEFAIDHDFKFPYLFDETQAVAKAYSAACTPDFYVYDKQHALVYRGQMDESRPGNGKAITGHDLKAGLIAAISDAAPPQNQLPSIGCSIKWRAGNEPNYF